MKSHIQGILRNRLIIILTSALVITGAIAAAFAWYIGSVTTEVTLKDDGHMVQLLTTEKTVGAVLEKYGVVLRPEDEVKPALNEAITNDSVIEITRAFKVSVLADRKMSTIYVTAGTVAQVLEKANVTLRENDLVNYGLYEQVTPGDFIRVTRMDEATLLEKEPIPYQVVTRKNHDMDEGVEKVVQEGKQGELEKKVLVAYRDGVEISRRVIDEEVVVEPVDRIIERGTVKTMTTSRGDKIRYSKVESFRATAYTHTGNRTRTGIWPEEGIIAVDPRVIPLHRTVYVEFPKGWEHLNGFYRAKDTGGAIKGNIIDVFMGDEGSCRRFGRRSVKVYFVK